MAMAEIPKQMQAVKTCDWPKTQRIFNLICHFSLAFIGNDVASVQTVPIPVPSEHQLLVRIKAVALNPTDWKHVDYISPAGSRIGCDYSGVVVKVSQANKRDFSIGDRVAGSVHGGLYVDQGSFAEYTAVDDDLVFKIPDNINDMEAAALGVSSLTAMQALNIYLGLPWPDEDEAKSTETATIFIYSGATTSGLMMIQLAKLCGYLPVITCSPRSVDLAKRYGAVATFDYHSSTAVEEIRKSYPNIKVAVDCFSEGSSFDFCTAVVTGNGGGEIATLMPGKSKTADVKITPILAYTLMGKSFQYFAPIGPRIQAIPSHRIAAARFAQLMPSYLETGVIKPLPYEKIEGGLDAVISAFDKLRKKEVSGKKLVVELKS